LGDLDKAALDSLLSSPAREDIAGQLAEGKACIFVLLSGEDKKASDEAEKTAKKLIQDVASGKDLDVENYGIAVRLRKKKLLDNLNAALEKLEQKGIYSRIYGKWFGSSRPLPSGNLGPSWDINYDDDEDEMKISDEE
jgi:hypothetical protein